MIINLPEHLDLTHPENYILTIGINPDEGYSFSLYNPVQDGSYYYHALKLASPSDDPFEQFKEAYFDNAFFSLPYRKVILMSYSTEYMFIPTLLYHNQFKSMLMASIAGAEDANKVLEQEIKHLDQIILHQMDPDVYSFFERSYINARFVHFTAPLITYYLEKSRTIKARVMLLNIREETIDVFCFHQGEFLFGNQFVYEKDKDIIYHALYVWKEFKFNQLKDILYITGQRVVPTMKKLQKNIQNIVPAQIVPEKHFEGVDTKEIPLEFSVLTLCEV